MYAGRRRPTNQNISLWPRTLSLREVFEVCFISLLGIQVMTSLVFSRSLVRWVLARRCCARGGIIPAPAASATITATAANCWVGCRSGSRLSFPLYLWPWPHRGTLGCSLCLRAPGRGLSSPVRMQWIIIMFFWDVLFCVWAWWC